MVQILEFEREIFALENQVRELVSLSHMYDSVGDITHEIVGLHKKSPAHEARCLFESHWLAEDAGGSAPGSTLYA